MADPISIAAVWAIIGSAATQAIASAVSISKGKGVPPATGKRLRLPIGPFFIEFGQGKPQFGFGIDIVPVPGFPVSVGFQVGTGQKPQWNVGYEPTVSIGGEPITVRSSFKWRGSDVAGGRVSVSAHKANAILSKETRKAWRLGPAPFRKAEKLLGRSTISGQKLAGVTWSKKKFSCDIDPTYLIQRYGLGKPSKEIRITSPIKLSVPREGRPTIDLQVAVKNIDGQKWIFGLKAGALEI